MKKENGPRFVWVNGKKAILSFHSEEGFEKLRFESRAAMFAFVMEKSKEGYLIQ